METNVNLWSNTLDFAIWAPFILIQSNLRYITNFEAKTALKRPKKKKERIKVS
jgi:hypothetical protein